MFYAKYALIPAVATICRYTGINALKTADHGNAARSSQIARNIGENGQMLYGVRISCLNLYATYKIINEEQFTVHSFNKVQITLNVIYRTTTN